MINIWVGYCMYINVLGVLYPFSAPKSTRSVVGRRPYPSSAQVFSTLDISHGCCNFAATDQWETGYIGVSGFENCATTIGFGLTAGDAVRDDVLRLWLSNDFAVCGCSPPCEIVWVQSQSPWKQRRHSLWKPTGSSCEKRNSRRRGSLATWSAHDSLRWQIIPRLETDMWCGSR